MGQTLEKILNLKDILPHSDNSPKPVYIYKLVENKCEFMNNKSFDSRKIASNFGGIFSDSIKYNLNTSKPDKINKLYFFSKPLDAASIQNLVKENLQIRLKKKLIILDKKFTNANRRKKKNCKYKP